MRRVASILLALLTCGALLGLLELGLRATGLGDVPAHRGSRLRYQQVFPPVLVPATRGDGVAVLATRDPRLPAQAVRAERAPDTLRVFCFGGSATAGLGFSPNVTFPRYLERMLREALPDREVEVVNLGIVALPSNGARLLVEEVCARYEPDALVVYSGNNEFLELHSQRYFEATATLPDRAVNRLANTNLWRLLGGSSGDERPPTLAEVAAASSGRVSHRDMMRAVEIDAEDVAGVVARYRANLEGMAAAAAAADVPLVLCTVASNWEWWGVEDLAGPDDAAAAGTPLPSEAVDLHEHLFRRARLAAAAGEWATARDAYRAAMNADPHLRRAIDALAEEVRAVCAETDAHLLDAIEVLAADAEHGIVGWDAFYDYVHFTPRGAARLAAEVAQALEDARVVPAGTVDEGGFLASEWAELETWEADALAVGRFLGVGDDLARIGDRDLWKYDRLLADLDARLAADPGDWRAHVWRGNASFFRLGEAARAREHYEAALALVDDPVVRDNLARLSGDRRP